MPTSASPRRPAQKVGFIRLESYGFKSSKGRRTIPGVINEMTRRPSAIPHVSAPIAEIPLFCPFGPPSGAIPLIRQKIVEFDSLSPQRLRKDAQLLVAGVASYPVESAEMLESPAEWRAFGDFCEYTVTFLREEFGERVHSVVAHIADERFPHIHFMLLPYTVPENGGKLGIGANHPGKHADDRGPNRRQKYKAAMKAFLDRFHERVGKLMGWARIGAEPRQRNPNRKQYLWFRDLWEKLTSTGESAADANRPDDLDDLDLVGPPALAPTLAPSPSMVQPEEPTPAPTPAAKPRKKSSTPAVEIEDMQRDGNAEETLKKQRETFHLPEKRSISPMRRRF